VLIDHADHSREDRLELTPAQADASDQGSAFGNSNRMQAGIESDERVPLDQLMLK